MPFYFLILILILLPFYKCVLNLLLSLICVNIFNKFLIWWWWFVIIISFAHIGYVIIKPDFSMLIFVLLICWFKALMASIWFWMIQRLFKGNVIIVFNLQLLFLLWIFAKTRWILIGMMRLLKINIFQINIRHKLMVFEFKINVKG